MKSARFFTSPSVQDTLPPNWAAISVGPCQSEVWLSMTPPINSASETASRCASQVTFVKMPRGYVDRVVDGSGLAVNQRVGEQTLGRVMAKPRFAETAGALG